MKFSERFGFTVKSETLQLSEMSQGLRNQIWNCIYKLCGDEFSDRWYKIAELIFIKCLKLPLDEIPDQYFAGHFVSTRKILKKYFMTIPFYDVYDWVETIVSSSGIFGRQRETLQDLFNAIYISELSGYRLVDGKHIAITNEVELAAINQALQIEDRYSGVKEHIKTSINKLAEKPFPDYRNSIKESISAVESICKLLSGGKSISFDQAIRKLDLHPALEQGFIKLYAWTSDEKGVRHATFDSEMNVGLTEAIYMLVTCSAFVNFVIEKMEITGSL